MTGQEDCAGQLRWLAQEQWDRKDKGLYWINFHWDSGLRWLKKTPKSRRLDFKAEALIQGIKDQCGIFSLR